MLCGFPCVTPHSGSRLVHYAEVILRVGISLPCGLSEPLGGLPAALPDAVAVKVHLTKLKALNGILAAGRPHGAPRR